MSDADDATLAGVSTEAVDSRPADKPADTEQTHPEAPATDDAPKSDAPLDEAPKEEARPANPRELIVESARKLRDQDLKDAAEQMGVSPPEDADTGAESEAGDGEKAEKTAGKAEPGDKPDAKPRRADPVESDIPGVYRDAEGRALVKMKVNGRDKFEPLETALVNAQKVDASNEKFTQAAEMRRQALEMRATYEASRKEATPAERKEMPKAEDVDWKKVVENLRYSDNDDEAVAALQDAVAKTIQTHAGNTGAQPNMDMQMIAREAAVIGRQEQEHWSAVEKFGEEFSEIVSDKRLAGYAVQETYNLRAEDLVSNGYSMDEIKQVIDADPVNGPKDLIKFHRHLAQQGLARSDHDLYREAGNRTRQWLDQFTGKATRNTPEPQAGARVEAKRSRANDHNLPAAAGRHSERPEPPAPTRSDVIQNMKRQRGQA